MLSIQIICMGKMGQKFYAAAAQEYLKRLSRFAKITITELQDQSAPEKLSELERESIKDKEGERILAKIKQEHVIALEITGQTYSSTDWADHLQKLMSTGHSQISFIIGGSLGLSRNVLARTNEKLSFSSFTFCHQLARVVLLEQLFRAFKINANEAYHK